MYRTRIKSTNGIYYNLFIKKSCGSNQIYFKLDEILEIERLLNDGNYNLKAFEANDMIFFESLDWEYCTYNLLITKIDHRKKHIYLDTLGF